MGGSPLAGLAALGLGGIGGGPNAGPVNPAGLSNSNFITDFIFTLFPTVVLTRVVPCFISFSF